MPPDSIRHIVVVGKRQCEGRNTFLPKHKPQLRSCPNHERFALLTSPTTEISKTISFTQLNANPAQVKLMGQLAILKSAYSNGKIYFYRGCWKERQSRTGMTRNTFARCVSNLLEIGWATKNGKHIILKGKEEIADMYGSPEKHRFTKIDLTQNIVNQLRYFLLNTKVNQAAYRISEREALDPTVRKKYLKLVRAAYLPMSGKTLSEIFERSKSSANGIVRRLQSEGRIKIKKGCMKTIGSCTWKQWLTRFEWWSYDERITQCFFHKGHIFFNEISRYKTVFPIAKKKRQAVPFQHGNKAIQKVDA